MRTMWITAAGTLALGAGLAQAGQHEMTGVTVGQAAPDFTLPTLDDRAWKLSDHRGKIVVLEWYNPDCPFVVHAHGEGGPLRDMGMKEMSEGVVWVAINSGAEGKQGAGHERNRKSLAEYDISYPILLDAKGDVGRTYAAKTTPQMVVIDADGKVAYQGALDNAPLGKVNGGGTLQTWTQDAIDAVQAGKAPSPAQTQSYGCSVKY